MHLSALHLYPVKSCRGCSVTSAEVDAHGLVGDRRFLVVDGRGQFLTQRAHPRLTLIETTLTADTLTLSSPNHGSVSVPLPFHLSPSTSAPRRVTVWKDTVDADDCGDAAAEWLSRFLGFPCRLVHAGARYSRPIPARKLTSTQIRNFVTEIAETRHERTESGNEGIGFHAFTRWVSSSGKPAHSRQYLGALLLRLRALCDLLQLRLWGFNRKAGKTGKKFSADHADQRRCMGFFSAPSAPSAGVCLSALRGRSGAADNLQGALRFLRYLLSNGLKV